MREETVCKKNINGSRGKKPLSGLTVCSDIRDQTKFDIIRTAVSDLGGILRQFSIALREAYAGHIRILDFDNCMKCLRAEEDRFSCPAKRLLRKKRSSAFVPTTPQKKPCNLSPRHLNAPFLKVEDSSGTFRPEWKEFKQWPAVCLQQGTSRSVFHAPQTEHERGSVLSTVSDQNIDNKEMSPRRSPRILKKSQKESGKQRQSNFRCRKEILLQEEMRKTHIKKEVSRALCEICDVLVDGEDDINSHLDSQLHTGHVNVSGFFATIDKEISKGTKVEDFVSSFLDTTWNNDRLSGGCKNVEKMEESSSESGSDGPDPDKSLIGQESTPIPSWKDLPPPASVSLAAELHTALIGQRVKNSAEVLEKLESNIYYKFCTDPEYGVYRKVWMVENQKRELPHLLHM